MSDRYPLADLTDLPVDLRERILAEQEKAGFVPEVFLMFGRRPAESRAFFAYHDALMEREGNLSKADKEMIVVTISGQNNCLFCVVAHGAILRIVKKDPLIADQLAVNYRKADLTPRERAICDFATKVNLHSDELGDADFALAGGAEVAEERDAERLDSSLVDTLDTENDDTVELTKRVKP